MPGIGRPEGLDGPNPFKSVRKAAKQVSRGINSNLSDQEILNRAAGKEEMGNAGSIKYVDGDKQGKLDKDGFLKLLTFQLQNQDPSKPMDQDKIAADMAQYSQLEQLTNMNNTLTKSFEKAPMEAKFHAASFLGKKVVTNGSTVKFENGQRPNMNFKLGKPVSKGMVRIFDQKNQLVSQIDFQAKPAGLHSISWGGRQLDNTIAAKGVYRFEVLAFDQMGNKIPAETKAEGTVQSVAFEKGEAVLTVDGKKVFLRDVQSFHVADNGEVGHNKNNSQNSMNAMKNMQSKLNAIKDAQKSYQQNSEGMY